MADVPVALLAGGLATRLRPITTTIPKSLVEVAGKPFLDHQLRLLARNRVRRVVLCIGHLGEMIEEYAGDGRRYGLDLKYVYDGPTLLGTGGALRQALPHLGSLFWILYGDSYLDIDYAAVLRDFHQQGKRGLMTVMRNGNQWDRSNVVFRNGKLLTYDKKTLHPDMEYIDYGASLLRREVLEAYPEGQPFDLADVFHDLVARRDMAGSEMTRRFYEIGSPTGIEQTSEYIRRAAA